MRSIVVPGVTHGAVPIPMAAKRGPLVMSSGIGGKDPATDAAAATPEEEAAWIFAHVATVLEAAGGSPADVVKLTFYVRDRSLRQHIDPHWLAMFPDPDDRPARHTVVYGDLPPGMSMQCDLVAYVIA